MVKKSIEIGLLAVELLTYKFFKRKKVLSFSIYALKNIVNLPHPKVFESTIFLKRAILSGKALKKTVSNKKDENQSDINVQNFFYFNT